MLKKCSSVTLLFVLISLFAAAAHASAASTTGVCTEVPNAENLCPAKFYLEGEKFKGANLANTVITEGVRVLECKKSEYTAEIGKNPVTNAAVSFKVTALTWSECKTGSGSCVSIKSPGEGDTAFPWASTMGWVTGALTEANGTMTINKFSVGGECGTQKCGYIGAGAENSISGDVYNANSLSKPLASTRAEVQFNKVKLSATGECMGTVEFTAVYTILPNTEPSRDVYLTNG